jgi:hypothetical protein
MTDEFYSEKARKQACASAGGSVRQDGQAEDRDHIVE